MVATWMLWLFVLGVAVGAVVTAVALVRLPRRDDDVSAAERPTEAEWISAVIEHNGGVAPALLVEEVLELRDRGEHLAMQLVYGGEAARGLDRIGTGVDGFLFLVVPVAFLALVRVGVRGLEIHLRGILRLRDDG